MDFSIDYWYEGRCPRSGQWQRLPRTALARAIATGLMHQLQVDPQFNQEGKMYGILLVQTATGQPYVLKAFSGLLQGQSQVSGWVPPIPGREKIAFEEAHTLEQLDAIKQRLIRLQQIPERQTHAELTAEFARQQQQLNQGQRQRKHQRHQTRQQLSASLSGTALQTALADIDQQSRRDKADLRRLKQTQAQQLAPLAAAIDAADQAIRDLKAQRKALSRQLQTTMHRVYSLTNFAGDARCLQSLAPAGNLPTGTGDCCAPKLLHFAATHGLHPLAMAEFWWGSADPQQQHQPGEFYGACADRCQPIMGFLLSGLSAQVEAAVIDQPPGPILYEDGYLIAVDKPAGLLSVPGRYGHRQDSVLSRLRHQLPAGAWLSPVHRLDQDTSGILLLARDTDTHRALSQQFQQRTVKKVYEAVVEGQIANPTGTIDLPLWGNPHHRPRQTVDGQRGKPSQTTYRLLHQSVDTARVEFRPLTGRTHQLRVHAAHPQGLGTPIRGDRLYGKAQPYQRLHLHARELQVCHPHNGQTLYLGSIVPF
jgi:tRNA pseudouridine32 synthase/23S rRNA pseudouridine746 synthase